jgi:hypothetical protein
LAGFIAARIVGTLLALAVAHALDRKGLDVVLSGAPALSGAEGKDLTLGPQHAA